MSQLADKIRNLPRYASDTITIEPTTHDGFTPGYPRPGVVDLYQPGEIEPARKDLPTITSESTLQPSPEPIRRNPVNTTDGRAWPLYEWLWHGLALVWVAVGTFIISVIVYGVRQLIYLASMVPSFLSNIGALVLGIVAVVLAWRLAAALGAPSLHTNHPQLPRPTRAPNRTTITQPVKEQLDTPTQKAQPERPRPTTRPSNRHKPITSPSQQPKPNYTPQPTTRARMTWLGPVEEPLGMPEKLRKPARAQPDAVGDSPDYETPAPLKQPRPRTRMTWLGPVEEPLDLPERESTKQSTRSKPATRTRMTWLGPVEEPLDFPEHELVKQPTRSKPGELPARGRTRMTWLGPVEEPLDTEPERQLKKENAVAKQWLEKMRDRNTGQSVGMWQGGQYELFAHEYGGDISAAITMHGNDKCAVSWLLDCHNPKGWNNRGSRKNPSHDDWEAVKAQYGDKFIKDVIAMNDSGMSLKKIANWAEPVLRRNGHIR